MATFFPDASPGQGHDNNDSDKDGSDYKGDYEFVVLGSKASGHESRSGI